MSKLMLNITMSLDGAEQLATHVAAAPVPTLVLAGELDASTAPEIMEGIAERIPGSTYSEVPGTPHMQTLSKPSLVDDALDQFLPLEDACD